MIDDRTILRRYRAGSSDAAQTLWDRHAPCMLAYARGFLTGTPLDARDIVQQAFCRILQRPVREVRRVRDPRAWMVTIVRTIACNARRSHDRARARDRGHADLSPQPGTMGQSKADLVRALGGLTDAQREVVLLRHASGLTFDQIATVTDEPRSTLASRYRAAIAQLRRDLGAQHMPCPREEESNVPRTYV